MENCSIKISYVGDLETYQKVQKELQSEKMTKLLLSYADGPDINMNSLCDRLVLMHLDRETLESYLLIPQQNSSCAARCGDNTNSVKRCGVSVKDNGAVILTCHGWQPFSEDVQQQAAMQLATTIFSEPAQIFEYHKEIEISPSRGK